MSLNVKDYGAVGDGASHPLSGKYATLAAAQVDYPFATALTQELDWAGIQKTLNLAQTQLSFGGPLGGMVALPSGQYLISDTLAITNVYQQCLEGEGANTLLRWHGLSTSPVFLLTNANACHFRNFWIFQSNVADSAFRLVNGGVIGSAGTTWIPSACVFEDIDIGGFSGNAFQYCIDINSSGAGGDGNNELHRFIRCSFASYSQAAVHVKASQAHALSFYDCQMLGMGIAPYGVYCEYGGYIRWFRGSGGSHTVSDFNLLNFLLVSSIEGWNSEGSVRLLQVWNGGANCNVVPITVANCRWEGNPPADGNIITNYSPGILNIVNNYFRGSTANPLVANGTFPGCGDQSVIHIGNAYVGPAAYTQSALSTAGSPQDYGNLYFNPADGTWHNFGVPGLFASLTSANQFLAQNTFAQPTFFHAAVGLDAASTTLWSTVSNRTYGLTYDDVAADGRMRLRHTQGNLGILFWGSNLGSSVEFESEMRCIPPAFLKDPWIGNTADNAGNNFLRFTLDQQAAGGDLNIWTVAWPGTGTEPYPHLTLTAPGIRFYASPGVWPNGAKSGLCPFEMTPDGYLWLHDRPVPAVPAEGVYLFSQNGTLCWVGPGGGGTVQTVPWGAVAWGQP